MADIIHKCCVCEQEFRPEGLDKDGKCAVCRVEYPTVKSKKEAMALNRPEIHLGEKVDVEKVKQIVKEAINELKAELMPLIKLTEWPKQERLRKTRKMKKRRLNNG